jgi:hypothetical protein
MEINPEGAEMFHAVERKDRPNEAAAFRKSVNAQKI